MKKDANNTRESEDERKSREIRRTLPASADALCEIVKNSQKTEDFCNLGLVLSVFVLFSFSFAKEWWFVTSEQLLPFKHSPIVVAAVVLGTMCYVTIKIMQKRDRAWLTKGAALKKLGKISPSLARNYS